MYAFVIVVKLYNRTIMRESKLRIKKNFRTLAYRNLAKDLRLFGNFVKIFYYFG
jgi:hypothetical protein